MSHTSFKIGRLTCHALDGGAVRLDGGAMFGIVPKVLWQKRMAPDERNRITLAMRCLLVEHPDGLVLVDTGLGNKENAKFKDIYGVDNVGQGGRTRLEDALGELGHPPADVAWVVNSHLHFDHAGGNTFRNAGGELGVTFPRARYVVQRGELEFARRLNERTAASYLPANVDPVPFMPVDGEVEVVPGIRCLPTAGKTFSINPRQTHFYGCSVSPDGWRLAVGAWGGLITIWDLASRQEVATLRGHENRVQALCFLADVVPTSAHLPLPWIMGFDIEPLVTLESKRRLYGRAEAEGWLLMFEHDPDVALGRLARDGRTFGLVEPVRAG